VNVYKEKDNLDDKIVKMKITRDDEATDIDGDFEPDEEEEEMDAVVKGKLGEHQKRIQEGKEKRQKEKDAKDKKAEEDKEKRDNKLAEEKERREKRKEEEEERKLKQQEEADKRKKEIAAAANHPVRNPKKNKPIEIDGEEEEEVDGHNEVVTMQKKDRRKGKNA